MTNINLSNYHKLATLYNERKFRVNSGKKGKSKTTGLALAEKQKAKNITKLRNAIKKNAKNPEKLLQYIAENTCTDLNYFNPHRVIPCSLALLKAMEAHKVRLKDAYMITIIEKKHETSNLIFDARDAAFDLDAIKQNFIEGLDGLNFLATVEFAYFIEQKKHGKIIQKVRHTDGGELIAPHMQGILWSDQLTTKKKKQLNEVFSGGRNEADGFYAVKIDNIPGAVGYMTKLPTTGYRIRDIEETYEHTGTYLQQPKMFCLFNRLRRYTFDDMLVSGGDGDAVREIALHYLRNNKGAWPDIDEE